MSWTANVDGLATGGYEVAYSTSNTLANCAAGAGITVTPVSAGTLTLSIGSLSSNTTYKVRVCSVNTNPTSGVSTGATSSGKTWQTAPGDPTITSVTPTSTSALTVNWTANADGLATSGYKVAYSKGSTAANCAAGAGITVTPVSAGNLTLSIGGLSSNTAYNVRVCSVNTNPTSGVSTGDTSSGTTWQTAPGDPTITSVTPTSTSALTVNWTANADGLATSGYKVAYSTSNTLANCAAGAGITVSAVGAGTLTLSIGGLSSNTTYKIRVCSVNTNPSSGVSTGPTSSGKTWQTAPGDPTITSVTATSTSALTVNWTANADGLATSGYEVAYSTGSTSANCAPGAGITVTPVSAGTLTLSIGSLSSNTAYNVRVCSVNTNPTSGVSGGATSAGTTWQTAPGDPTITSVTPTSTSALTVNWTANADGLATSGYKVAYSTGSTSANCAAGAGITVTPVSAGTLTLSIGSLSSNSTYNVRVCSVNTNPTSGVSTGAISSGKTWQLPPGDPTITSVTATSTSALSINWTDPDGLATGGYDVAYSTSSTLANCAAGAGFYDHPRRRRHSDTFDRWSLRRHDLQRSRLRRKLQPIIRHFHGCDGLANNPGNSRSNPSDLMAISCSGAYQLANDIDMSGVKFTPLCSSGFTGAFNGNGFKISNLSYLSWTNSITQGLSPC